MTVGAGTEIGFLKLSNQMKVNDILLAAQEHHSLLESMHLYIHYRKNNIDNMHSTLCLIIH